MSFALLAQIESNTSNGGSAIGYLTGTDTTSAADAFYGRRLTDKLYDPDSIVAFTPSTGGTGTSSTAGQFTLTPGTYRITIRAVYNLDTLAANALFGLYNVTSSAFEVYLGGSEPILSEPFSAPSSNGSGNVPVTLDAIFEITTTNKTYEIRHKGSTTSVTRDTFFGGQATSMTGANVNSAAARNTYCLVRIAKTA